MRPVQYVSMFAVAIVSIVVTVMPGRGSADTSVPAYDVVVYGATPSGVMSAVQAARAGKTTALVEPSRWIGGMATGGLSHVDVGPSPSVIGGLPREYFRRVASLYGKSDLWDTEPRAALKVMTQMLGEAGVPVYVSEPLDRQGGVTKVGTTILSIRTTTGREFTARQYIDATYEGDLMAAAGVSYALGRESRAQYGETVAGVRPFAAGYKVSIPARDEQGNVYPEVDPSSLGPVGSADNHVQAYNYRVTSTTKASNRIPYPMPSDYDPRRFSLLSTWLTRLQSTLGRPLTVADVLTMRALPNQKFDTNNNGAFSTDYLNGSFRYSEASDADRAEIAEQTKRYDEGLLYFLQNDPTVPTSLHKGLAAYGLAKDEYTDNQSWPTQLYVRESRRMVGAYVLRQQDLEKATPRADTVAQGSYRIDQHNSFRGIDQAGNVANEGAFSLTTKSPYPIPYGVIVPRVSEATNLLVTGALSTTHVAWSSIRMEPQFMMLGQAAGDAAALAIDGATTVQDVPVLALRERLLQQAAVLPADPTPPTTSPSTPSASPSATTAAPSGTATAAPTDTTSPTTSAPTPTDASSGAPSTPVTVVVDNTDAGFSTTGSWAVSTSSAGYLGVNYVHNGNAADGRTATWSTSLPSAKTWAVYARWTAYTNRSPAATYTVWEGDTILGRVTVDQRSNGGTWVPLGTYLLGGSVTRITVSGAASTGYVVADAVRLVG